MLISCRDWVARNNDASTSLASVFQNGSALVGSGTTRTRLTAAATLRTPLLRSPTAPDTSRPLGRLPTHRHADGDLKGPRPSARAGAEDPDRITAGSDIRRSGRRTRSRAGVPSEPHVPSGQGYTVHDPETPLPAAADYRTLPDPVALADTVAPTLCASGTIPGNVAWRSSPPGAPSRCRRGSRGQPAERRDRAAGPARQMGCGSRRHRGWPASRGHRRVPGQGRPGRTRTDGLSTHTARL